MTRLTPAQRKANRIWSRKMMDDASKNRCVENCGHKDESGYCYIFAAQLTAYVSPEEEPFFKKHTGKCQPVMSGRTTNE